MLGFFKKTNRVVAPIDGTVIELSKVPSQIFSERMAGDGVAILSTGNVIVAPVEGKVTMIFATNHAFSITTSEGIQVLVHIGVDSIGLQGKGFQRLVEEGTFVKTGEPIIKVNRDEIISRGYDLITPVLIVNPDMIRELQGCHGVEVNAGENEILTYKIK